jgi:hypothetical protein
MDPPAAFVTFPGSPIVKTTPSTPEIEPVLVMKPSRRDTPMPSDEATSPPFATETTPTKSPWSMPSSPGPVEVTEPVLVIVSGLSPLLMITGPATLVLIVLGI